MLAYAIESAESGIARIAWRGMSPWSDAEIGAPARFADLVFLWNREDDPEALDAVSRAMARSRNPGQSAETRLPPIVSE